MNPELRRNLWLQLSWPRLLLTPLLLGVVFAVIWTGMGKSAVTYTAVGLFWAVTLLWGTRQAADSVGEEVAGGTWHGQRMSSLGAWPMTWGKLLGATAFSWFIALICLAVYQGTWDLAAVTSCPDRNYCIPDGRCFTPEQCRAQYERFWLQPLWMVAAALYAQAVALAVALAALRRRPLSLRIPVTLAQAAGITGLFVAAGIHSEIIDAAPNPLMGAISGFRTVERSPVVWFGQVSDALAVGEILLALALAVAVFAAYRLMRAALQYRSMPWGIVASAALLGMVLMGFRGGQSATLTAPIGQPALFLAACLAAYAGIFADRIDPPRLRRLAQALIGGNAVAGCRQMPGGLAAFLFAVPAGIAFIVLNGTQAFYLPFSFTALPSAHMQPAAIIVPAMLLFVLRDMAVVLWLHLAGISRRADVAALVTLAVLHLLQPFLLDSLGLGPLALARLGTGGAGVATIGFAAVEAAVACALLLRRWRKAVAAAPSRM